MKASSWVRIARQRHPSGDAWSPAVRDSGSIWRNRENFCSVWPRGDCYKQTCMLDDAELLRCYAAHGAQDAMAELVRRHVGLVYHAALRICGGDHHLAEDVAQSVFTDLARKAGALARRASIVGWLHTSAHHAAVQTVRAEVRRRAREQKAHAMIEPLHEPAAPGEWRELRPVLDRALNALAERDREAVLLRFFEGHPLTDIGARFGISEDAARMRVERALDKLRTVLTRHGIRSTAAALGATLATQASTAVPAAVVASTTAAAVAVSAATPVLVVTTFFTMTKLQLGIAMSALALGCAGLVWQHQMNTRLQAQVTNLQRVADENDRVRRENQRLVAAQSTDLKRSSRSADAMPDPRGKTGTTAADNAPAGANEHPTPLAPGLIPVETLGNAGAATPRAALATQLWAARSGDIDLEASVIALTPEGSAALQKAAAKLPATVTAQYGSPEKLMAFALAGSPHPVGGMEVVGETAEGADDIVLQTRWQHVDDAIVHQSDIHLHRTATGWKMVVPTPLADRSAAYLVIKP